MSSAAQAAGVLAEWKLAVVVEPKDQSRANVPATPIIGYWRDADARIRIGGGSAPRSTDPRGGERRATLSALRESRRHWLSRQLGLPFRKSSRNALTLHYAQRAQ